MVKVGEIINKLQNTISNNSLSSYTTTLESIIADRFEESIKEESFYSIPIPSLIAILNQYSSFKDTFDAELFTETIKRIVLTQPESKTQLLTKLSAERASSSAIRTIFSYFTNIPILNSLNVESSEEKKESDIVNSFLIDSIEDPGLGEKSVFSNIFIIHVSEKVRTVGDLKLQIEKEKQIPAKEQILGLDRTFLPDHKEIKDIGANKTLKLLRRGGKFVVFVKDGNGITPIYGVTLEMTVNELKKSIQKAKNVPRNFTLCFNGKNVGNENIQNAGIFHKAMLLIN